MAMIYLVRHGQASFGSDDYDRLSDIGRRQARWLGEHFGGHGIAFRRVVAGRLLRQQDTAAEILRAMAVDGAPRIETHPGLDEYDAAAIYAAHTGERDPVAHQNADFKGYWRRFREAMTVWSEGGLPTMHESWDEFGARTSRALAFASEGGRREDHILVVSSGGAMCRALAQLLSAPASVAIELNLQYRNTGVSELISGGSGLRLLSYNAIPHLDRPGRREAITYA